MKNVLGRKEGNIKSDKPIIKCNEEYNEAQLDHFVTKSIKNRIVN